MDQHPKHINQHEAATILFATDPLVVEKFSEIPELGRFVLVRDKNIGAGVVLETSEMIFVLGYRCRHLVGYKPEPE